MNKLGNQQWGRSMSNCDSETDEKATGDEHTDSSTDRLQNDANNHDDASNCHTGTSSSKIGYIRSNWKSNDRSDRHNGIQETSS